MNIQLNAAGAVYVEGISRRALGVNGPHPWSTCAVCLVFDVRKVASNCEIVRSRTITTLDAHLFALSVMAVGYTLSRGSGFCNIPSDAGTRRSKVHGGNFCRGTGVRMVSRSTGVHDCLNNRGKPPCTKYGSSQSEAQLGTPVRAGD